MLLSAFTVGFPEYQADKAIVPGRRELVLTSPEDQKLSRIICPVLAAGVKHGQLRLDKEGIFDRKAFQQYAEELSIAPLLPILAPFPFINGPVELFEMNGNRQELEHGVSSGIRDPAPNRTAFEVLLSFAADDGTMGPTELTAAGKFFDAHPNPESHVELNPNKTGAEHAIVNFMLPIFGRCGGSQRELFHGLVLVPNPYPPTEYVQSVAKDGSSVRVPCTTDRVFLTNVDLEQLFWYNNYPAGFTFVNSSKASPPPPPPLASPLPSSSPLSWAQAWVNAGLVAGNPVAAWWASMFPAFPLWSTPWY